MELGTFEFNQSLSKVDIDALTSCFDDSFWKSIIKDEKDSLG